MARWSRLPWWASWLYHATFPWAYFSVVKYLVLFGFHCWFFCWSVLVFNKYCAAPIALNFTTCRQTKRTKILLWRRTFLRLQLMMVSQIQRYLCQNKYLWNQTSSRTVIVTSFSFLMEDFSFLYFWHEHSFVHCCNQNAKWTIKKE